MYKCCLHSTIWVIYQNKYKERTDTSLKYKTITHKCLQTAPPPSIDNWIQITTENLEMERLACPTCPVRWTGRWLVVHSHTRGLAL